MGVRFVGEKDVVVQTHDGDALMQRLGMYWFRIVVLGPKDVEGVQTKWCRTRHELKGELEKIRDQVTACKLNPDNVWRHTEEELRESTPADFDELALFVHEADKRLTWDMGSIEVVVREGRFFAAIGITRIYIGSLQEFMESLESQVRQDVAAQRVVAMLARLLDAGLPVHATQSA